MEDAAAGGSCPSSFWSQFPNNSVCAVNCQFALHYACRQKEDLIAVLREIGRVLRPGGVFYGTLPNNGVILEEYESKKPKEFSITDLKMFDKNSFSSTTSTSTTTTTMTGTGTGNTTSTEALACSTSTTSTSFTSLSTNKPINLGGEYFFYLPGHVDPPTKEYLVPLDFLLEAAERAGLHWTNGLNFRQYWKEAVKKGLVSPDGGNVHGKGKKAGKNKKNGNNFSTSTNPPPLPSSTTTIGADDDFPEVSRIYRLFVFRKPVLGPKSESAGQAPALENAIFSFTSNEDINHFYHDEDKTKNARKIAVYTGAFDPPHVNHLDFARFLLQDRGFHRVHMCVNANSPLKPFATPVETRLEMLKAAFENEELAGASSRINVRENNQGDWRGRDSLCREIQASEEKEEDGVATSRTTEVETYLILGRDSYEKALDRSSDWYGINSFPFKIMVLPRGDGGEDGDGGGKVKIPKELSNRVEVATDFHDLVVTSSSAIRAAILGCSASSVVNLKSLSPNVRNFIREHGLYRGRTQKQLEVLVLIGPRFSGKTTLALELLRMHEELAFQSSASSQNPRPLVIWENIELEDIPQREATSGKTVDCILELRCDKQTCKKRAALMIGQEEGEAETAHAYNLWSKRKAIRAEQLKNFEAATGLPVVALDSSVKHAESSHLNKAGPEESQSTRSHLVAEKAWMLLKEKGFLA
ncbi:unnamed protein product [Amoebophrya sp. A25]|nr:unnamed protein product [Amoebophrya sp. A25]|eukprot:GSA25T00010155001.1